MTMHCCHSKVCEYVTLSKISGTVPQATRLLLTCLSCQPGGHTLVGRCCAFSEDDDIAAAVPLVGSVSLDHGLNLQNTQGRIVTSAEKPTVLHSLQHALSHSQMLPSAGAWHQGAPHAATTSMMHTIS